MESADPFPGDSLIPGQRRPGRRDHYAASGITTKGVNPSPMVRGSQPETPLPPDVGHDDPDRPTLTVGPNERALVMS